jgi:dCMP deaminase
VLTSNDIIHPEVQEVFTDKWKRHFLKEARLTSEPSKDRSTKCGCVLVGMRRNILTSGYNGMPRGMNDDVEERHERPAKYAYFEHSERNAIFNAAYEGVALGGCVAFVTGPPCVDCTRAMIQSGVIAVIIPEHHNFKAQETADRWRESCQVALDMMTECGIHFEVVKGI